MRNVKFSWCLFLLCLVMIGTVVSCDRKDPVPKPPTNELKDKGHDSWAKVEIILREGHLHGSKFHENAKTKAPILPKIQKLTLTQTPSGVVRTFDKGNSLKKDVQAFEVVASEHGAYAAEIIYYNSKGERINYQFVTPEMLDIHQHFFTINQYYDLYDSNVTKKAPNNSYFTKLHNYIYRDTTPEDKMLGVDGSELLNKPVGLKGYFHFYKGGIKFNMTFRLNHFYTSKYNEKGVADPAINPSVRSRVQSATDLLQDIPFECIGTNGSDENKYMKELAKYYGVSVEDIENYIFEDVDPESGQYWM